MERILPQLAYWNTRLLKDGFLENQPHRYLSFDVDQGGLNNIRLVFEYAAVIAAISGRTLVLPPPKPWYLVNVGPKHRGAEEGVTDFAEMFEIGALSDVLPVLTTNEFIAEAAEHLSVPEVFRRWGNNDGEASRWREWSRWLLNKATVMEGWNPYDTVICYPNIESIQPGMLPERFVDGRDLIEFTPRINASPLIHFPNDEKHRSLGPVATMLAAADDRLPRWCRRLIKHHIRYKDEIFVLASELIAALGPYRYNAIHIRRNDFQYKDVQTGARMTWDNISSILERDLPVYIATDEKDPGFREALESQRSVLFWEDLVDRQGAGGIPEKYIGPIEQLICTCAARFIGTDLSTFSSYIVRLRGYTHAPDTASYYLNECYSDPKPEPGVGDFRGRNYLQENPLFWLDC